eukprot:1301369-Pyramimonas_sp.AAC.1
MATPLAPGGRQSDPGVGQPRGGSGAAPRRCSRAQWRGRCVTAFARRPPLAAAAAAPLDVYHH